MSAVPLRFRPKPLAVEAMQYTGQNTRDILVWILHVVGPTTMTFGIKSGQLVLHDGQEWRAVRSGSWIVRDLADQFSPVDEPIFNQKYEREDRP